ncbi:hypothetical protein [Spirosoma spitsbergense]|uniref:hypothetical protein n=1 Tax=Spirosoma spitsbergense TaxID=431554 RepID=UPI000381B74D|nr:hypothetical protein [Spirosoma spitsbergense]
MKQLKGNNRYLDKVRGELDVFQDYLLNGTELSPIQWETWDKIDSARAWLKQGHTDSQVLAMLKNSSKLQERRAREIMALAYSVFVELRQARDKEGIKDLYAELFRSAAKEAKEAGDFYNYGILLDKAAKIDGAYESGKILDSDTYKKPSKVVFKVKQLTVNNNAGQEPKTIQNATYEIGD